MLILIFPPPGVNGWDFQLNFNNQMKNGNNNVNRALNKVIYDNTTCYIPDYIVHVVGYVTRCVIRQRNREVEATASFTHTLLHTLLHLLLTITDVYFSCLSSLLEAQNFRISRIVPGTLTFIRDSAWIDRFLSECILHLSITCLSIILLEVSE